MSSATTEEVCQHFVGGEVNQNGILRGVLGLRTAQVSKVCKRIGLNVPV